jgi:hypothetical protein
VQSLTLRDSGDTLSLPSQQMLPVLSSASKEVPDAEWRFSSHR